MTNEREMKRLASQFLNGIAIAAVTTMILVPASAGGFNVWLSLAGSAAALLLHGAALALWRPADSHQEE